MKQLCRLFARTLIGGILFTHLILAVCELAGISAVLRFPVREVVYLSVVFFIMLIQLILIKMPSFPGARLGRILETEGYSAEFYHILNEWCVKCRRRWKVRSELAAAELFIDGGHYEKGFGLLNGIDPAGLEQQQRQIYYNTMLYGAVLCGDRAAADVIYRSGGKWLISVSKRPLAASVKHTLGCYEYLRGNADRAEELFVQALDAASSNDVVCEVWLALMVCYLDSGRTVNAHEALKKAAEYACTLPLKQKVARARELENSPIN